MKDGKVHIQVVGVGGGGCNAVHRIAQTDRNGIDFIAVNTDLQALNTVAVPRKLQIGANITNGYGSGARPEIARKAAEDDYNAIRELFSETDMVFLTAGLGGGTGTGATPIIAKAAKEMGAVTIAIVTKPFYFEGTKRAEIAAQGLVELRQITDTVLCIPNDRILKLAGPQAPIEEAFHMTDEVLNQTVTAISDLVSHVGIINIDYGDVANVLTQPGEAMIGFGEAAGEAHAMKATRYAMASSLLERGDIVGAKQVLISIVGGRDLTMKDVQDALQCVHSEIRGEGHVVFGVITRPDLENKARVALIATGLPSARKAQQNRPKAVKVSALNAEQVIFDFLPAETGRFVNLEPTLINSVNYDTPTFVRWGRKLVSDAA